MRFGSRFRADASEARRRPPWWLLGVMQAYLAVVALAWAFNVAVLQAALWGGVPAPWPPAAPLAAYTGCACLLQRHAVFRAAAG
ncbi:hypothetical protein [uncultured Azohydromonas sp.]|uniref:hypothetical protein n=1 Tax=uncultured Azohydromonas sp. TaxID=487342 RepID=UPI00261CF68A|nr:hypothetical protein [uncultured Azohydromonas sp.]